MSIDDADAALQIIDAGRRRVLARLQEAVADQMRLHGGLDELAPATLDELLAQGVDDAGASLWRISLAEGAADHFGVSVSEALHHPVIDAAEQLIGLAPEDGAAVAPETSWSEPEPVTAPDSWGTSEPEPEAAPDPWAAPAPAPESAPEAAPDPWAAPAPESAPDPWAAPEPDEEPEMYVPPGYEDDLAAAAVSDPEPTPDPDPNPWAAVPEPEPAPPEPAPIPQPVFTEPEPEPVMPAPAPAPAPEPEPAPVAVMSPAAIAVPQALRIAAIHTTGIESLKAGDEDIELRLSDAGLDVIKRSSGIAIGRLDWAEITALEVIEPGKRGRRRRKSKNRSLQVDTGGGQAEFELVGLSDAETAEHLEPLLARLRASGALAPTG